MQESEATYPQWAAIADTELPRMTRDHIERVAAQQYGVSLDVWRRMSEPQRVAVVNGATPPGGHARMV